MSAWLTSSTLLVKRPPNRRWGPTWNEPRGWVSEPRAPPDRPPRLPRLPLDAPELSGVEDESSWAAGWAVATELGSGASPSVGAFLPPREAPFPFPRPRPLPPRPLRRPPREFPPLDPWDWPWAWLGAGPPSPSGMVATITKFDGEAVVLFEEVGVRFLKYSVFVESKMNRELGEG